MVGWIYECTAGDSIEDEINSVVKYGPRSEKTCSYTETSLDLRKY